MSDLVYQLARFLQVKTTPTTHLDNLEEILEIFVVKRSLACSDRA